MKIQEIEVKNFKCFDSNKFELSDNFTVLIGDNGKGKTAILDALAVGISALLSGFDDATRRNISSDEVRLDTRSNGQVVNREPQYPVVVTCKGIFAGSQVTWTQSLQRKGQYQQDARISDLSKQLKQQVSQPKDVLLPLAAYYGTDRLWRPPSKKGDRPVGIVPRTWGYNNCFHPDSNVEQLIEWFKKLEQQALEQRASDGALEGVKSAVKECMESNWQNLTYDFSEGELIATFNDGRELPFPMLSDGVRNVLAMVADIAYRASVLNPHLGVNATKQTPGIVLIDEIDLHLHPSWRG